MFKPTCCSGVRRFPGALPDFSRRISEAINLVADAIIATASDDQVTAFFKS